MYADYDRRTLEQFEQSGLHQAAEREEAEHAAALKDRNATVPLLPSLGKKDELYQMQNPVRILTSGAERVTTKPFWANGEWRMCDRVKWWHEYTEDTPVVVGHYWRIDREGPGADVSDGKPNLFDGSKANEWVGTGGRVFCVDFSVGGRYRERRRKVTRFATRLAALRWPEREVVFDDGMRLEPAR